ncbi:MULTISPECIES: cutinase family protein [Gordonia]|uniref:cutinase family protein n=1 Tax=Gordonia TaxID=2053 RepID=UPI000A66C6FA|nr:MULTISPECIES: cutinase family protein [Gordonia]MCM3896315.1 cutinase family protein [Gordonia sputi]
MPKLSLPRSRSGRDRRISPQKSAARRIALLTGSLVVAAGGVLAAAPHASAASCPDVEVVFARGTAETAPPVGLTGLSFAQALRSQLPGKSVAVYGVNYPASNNFNNRVAFVRNVVDGITDAQDHIRATAARCPKTGIVLGGYSQGGAVAAYAANSGIAVPARYAEYASQAPKAMPAEVEPHVKAVVLFAPPSDRWIRDVGAPEMNVGPRYKPKTVTYCIAGDVVCDGAPVGQPNGLHVLYAVNGMNVQAAQYAAARL